MPIDDHISDADREMLRSILRKDNDRLEAAVEGAETQCVFRMNWEGGGTEITRYTTPVGKHYFRRSGGGVDIDENDDEVWNHYEGDLVSSFEEVLFFLGFGKEILCLRPSVVHPDYRDRMREYIDKLLKEVISDDRRRLGNRLAKTADQWFERLK